jgi:hypothetical protein
MNAKSMVRLSNIVGSVAVLALAYWVLVYIVMEVFELRVFRQRTSASFGLSILGILAVMAGALMTNVMFNLTRIAERHNLDAASPSLPAPAARHLRMLVALSFPLLVVLLFIGDRYSSRQQELRMQASAQSIIASNPGYLAEILEYRFGREWILRTGDRVAFYKKLDKTFPGVAIIVRDEADGAPIFLKFNDNASGHLPRSPEEDAVALRKTDFIAETSAEERAWLTAVFDGKRADPFFQKEGSRRDLFYPVTRNGRIVVFYFSEYGHGGLSS